MLARAFSAVGRTLIGAGVLLLLFVSFQLWGTGLHEARAQDTLHTQFAARLDAAPDVAKTASELTPKDPPAGGTSTTSTTATSSTTSTTISVAEETHVDHATPTPVKPGEALARIRIPKIGVDKLVVEGVTVEDLRKGPGHYRATPQPGYPGNASIAGHRTTYGAPFADIDRLVPGDRILVTTLHGNWTYEVVAAPDDPTSGHFIVSPEDVWVLGDFGDNRLTLTACHPKFSASQRIVVVARLLDPPASPTAAATIATARSVNACVDTVAIRQSGIASPSLSK